MTLPGTIAYQGPTDLKADGVRAADAIAASYFSASHGKPALSVRSQTLSGEQAYVITFHGATANSNAKRSSASQPAVVVTAGKPEGRRRRPPFTINERNSMLLHAQAMR